VSLPHRKVRVLEAVAPGLVAGAVVGAAAAAGAVVGAAAAGAAAVVGAAAAGGVVGFGAAGGVVGVGAAAGPHAARRPIPAAMLAKFRNRRRVVILSLQRRMCSCERVAPSKSEGLFPVMAYS
jgi:hypothetical protein